MRKEHAPKNTRKKQDTDFEIAFYESILKDTPDFIEALSRPRGFIHQGRSMAKGSGGGFKTFTPAAGGCAGVL